MSFTWHSRTVVETRRYEKQRDRIFQSVRRWDDAFRGIEQVLSEHPEGATLSDNVGVIKFRIEKKLYRLFYTYNEDIVRLRWVERVPVPEDSKLPEIV